MTFTFPNKPCYPTKDAVFEERTMSTQHLPVHQIFLKHILKDPLRYEWTLQGFGMLRLHLPRGWRLNIWHDKYRVPNVSLMHTHPWDFTSYILCGELWNTRYSYTHHMDPGGRKYSHGLIIPGPGGGKREELGLINLRAQRAENYVAGTTYRQQANEIHISSPKNGTVTINERRRTGPDVALVFWPAGTEWVSAEPRVATSEEVVDICSSVKV